MYIIWDDLETITSPIAICVAKSDPHAHDDALKIAENLPNGEVIEVPSNQFAHMTDVIPIIEDWILSNSIILKSNSLAWPLQL